MIPATSNGIDTLESSCDSDLQTIRRLLGRSMPPNCTGAYLHTTDLQSLFRHLDEISNRIERFSVDLAATDPAIDSDIRTCSRDMSARIVAAAELLVDALRTFVTGLLTAGTATSIEASVVIIAALESDCDAIRHRTLESVFADSTTAKALLVGDLLNSLDGVMNVIEDTGDHRRYLSSALV